jgi:hypothetical protein
MLDNIRCNLCNHYYKNAKVIRREERRNPNKKKNDPLTRKCLAATRTVTEDSPACKYFNPKENFWCDVHHCTLHLLNCANRRRNDKGFKTWDLCRSECRQFQKGIGDVISDYYLNQTPIKAPPKIKRRKKKVAEEDNPETKRKIKRRSKPKRVIKRRDMSEIKRKIKRKIKRREQKPKRVIKRRKR